LLLCKGALADLKKVTVRDAAHWGIVIEGAAEAPLPRVQPPCLAGVRHHVRAGRRV
jgi:hypothetical protein